MLIPALPTILAEIPINVALQDLLKAAVGRDAPVPSPSVPAPKGSRRCSLSIPIVVDRRNIFYLVAASAAARILKTNLRKDTNEASKCSAR